MAAVIIRKAVRLVPTVDIRAVLWSLTCPVGKDLDTMWEHSEILKCLCCVCGFLCELAHGVCYRPIKHNGHMVLLLNQNQWKHLEVKSCCG
jgi:hypothetical protein